MQCIGKLSTCTPNNTSFAIKIIFVTVSVTQIGMHIDYYCGRLTWKVRKKNNIQVLIGLFCCNCKSIICQTNEFCVLLYVLNF